MTWRTSPEYDKSAQADRTVVVNRPIPIEESLIDDTDLAAATNSYPAEGKVLGPINFVGIQGKIRGGVEFTVLGRISDDWVDITRSGYRADDHTTDNVSIVGNDPTTYEEFLIFFNTTNLTGIKIVSVTADATNSVKYWWRLKE